MSSAVYGYHWQMVHEKTGEVVNDGFSREWHGPLLGPDKVRGFVMAVTPVFNASQTDPGIEASVIIKCAEILPAYAHNLDGVQVVALDSALQAIRTLISQDGRTALEEFGMKVAQEVAMALIGLSASYQTDKLRAIVTNLMGIPPTSSEIGVMK